MNVLFIVQTKLKTILVFFHKFAYHNKNAPQHEILVGKYKDYPLATQVRDILVNKHDTLKNHFQFNTTVISFDSGPVDDISVSKETHYIAEIVESLKTCDKSKLTLHTRITNSDVAHSVSVDEILWDLFPKEETLQQVRYNLDSRSDMSTDNVPPSVLRSSIAQQDTKEIASV